MSTPESADHRFEHDALGEVSVPVGKLWGPQTQRAVGNFAIGGGRFRLTRPVIRAFGMVKKSAALANAELGQLPHERAELIAAAADEVIAGRWDDEFPLSIFQSGSGTQSNMNGNEVLARRAMQLAAEQGILSGESGGAAGVSVPSGPHPSPPRERGGGDLPPVHGGTEGGNATGTSAVQGIHPNDDVNRSQSTNDVFPTVMHIATVEELSVRLLPAVRTLHQVLDAKSCDYAGIVMLGRTHLQDATPITLGQVFSGWAAQLDQALRGIEQTMPGLYELAIGGTAVGTGVNAPARFGEVVARKIAEATGRPFVSAANKFAALSAHDAMVATSAALRTLAGALLKMANDVRWYASGPRGGIGELTFPENEPGSSIMPGKINPTQCESLAMIALQVFGNDQTVALAGSQGSFQLNTYKPLILHNVLESIDLLAEGCRSFTDRCARGIEPNQPRIERHLQQSLMLATALNPHIGYEKAAEIALAAHHENLSLRDAALRSGFVTAEQFDEWIRPEAMTRPLEEP